MNRCGNTQTEFLEKPEAARAKVRIVKQEVHQLGVHANEGRHGQIVDIMAPEIGLYALCPGERVGTKVGSVGKLVVRDLGN